MKPLNAHCCAEALHGETGLAGLEQPGTGWRTALAALVTAPARLHRYRNLRGRIFEDAMGKIDCERGG